MCLYVFIGLKSFAPHFQRLQCSACWKLGNGVQFSPIFPPWSQPGSEFNCKLKGFYRHVLHGYIVMFKCNSCWGQIHQHLNGYVGDIYIYIFHQHVCSMDITNIWPNMLGTHSMHGWYGRFVIFFVHKKAVCLWASRSGDSQQYGILQLRKADFCGKFCLFWWPLDGLVPRILNMHSPMVCLCLFPGWWVWFRSLQMWTSPSDHIP